MDTTKADWARYAPRMLAFSGRKQLLDVFAKAGGPCHSNAATSETEAKNKRASHAARSSSLGGGVADVVATSSERNVAESTPSVVRIGPDPYVRPSLPLNSVGAPSRAALTAALGKPFTPSQGAEPAPRDIRATCIIRVLS